jgi:hypothetical protein
MYTYKKLVFYTYMYLSGMICTCRKQLNTSKSIKDNFYCVHK